MATYTLVLVLVRTPLFFFGLGWVVVNWARRDPAKTDVEEVWPFRIWHV